MRHESVAFRPAKKQSESFTRTASSSGLMVDLLNRTEEYKTPNKIHAGRQTQTSGIFEPDFKIKKRLKLGVDMEDLKSKNKFAGNSKSLLRCNSGINLEPVSNICSATKQHKVLHLKSDLFNRGPDYDRVKREGIK